MTVSDTARRCAGVIPVFAVLGGAIVGMPAASADNKRLNDAVVSNVYTIQQNGGCNTELKINPKLQLAAEWHTNDVLNNRALDGDIGSDGSTPQSRAEAAGFRGVASETVAINPALAISGIELMNHVVLPARLHGDHVELREHPDRRVVGEQPGPHGRRRGLRPANVAVSA